VLTNELIIIEVQVGEENTIISVRLAFFINHTYVEGFLQARVREENSILRSAHSHRLIVRVFLVLTETNEVSIDV
jgi:hypothetical protein